VPVTVKDAQTVRNCQIVEEPKGILINAVSKEPFTYKDPCVQQDPHVNYDAEATSAAHGAVKAFLRDTFKLGTNRARDSKKAVPDFATGSDEEWLSGDIAPDGRKRRTVSRGAPE
jgi:hypothetical protein